MSKKFRSVHRLHIWCLGPGKKTWFFVAKTVGTFSQNRDFSWFLSWTQKPWKTCEFHKIRDLPWPKSQKLPNNRHNERAVVRIVIESGAEISDYYSASAWHCVTGTFLDGCFKLFKLTRLSLWNRVFNMKHVFFSKHSVLTFNYNDQNEKPDIAPFTSCRFLCLCGKKQTAIPWNRGTLLENRETT